MEKAGMLSNHRNKKVKGGPWGRDTQEQNSRI